MNLDFTYITSEKLDELIAKIKKVKEQRFESRKIDLWNYVRRAIDSYVSECGTIEVFTEDRNLMLDDDDSLKIPGKINLLD